jgi:hypothetical protein
MEANGGKRKLDEFFAAPSSAKLSAHSRETLTQLAPEALLDVAEALAKRCRALEAAGAPAAAAPASAPAPASAGLSAEQVEAQASKVCAIALKGIKGQMKWRPSCKQ